MRYVQAFIAAFAIGAVVTVGVRVSLVADTPSAPSVTGSDAATDQPARTPEPAKKPEPRQPEWTGPVVELKNHMDPVSGQHITDAVTSDYLGFRVRLGSANSKRTFEKVPIRYLMKLGLEVVEFDGEAKQPRRLKQVDAASYQTIALDNCLFMGGKIDVSRESYVLHRGFKIHFCCWNGCPEAFLGNPADSYDQYGLVERDGTLVMKGD